MYYFLVYFIFVSFYISLSVSLSFALIGKWLFSLCATTSSNFCLSRHCLHWGDRRQKTACLPQTTDGFEVESKWLRILCLRFSSSLASSVHHIQYRSKYWQTLQVFIQIFIFLYFSYFRFGKRKENNSFQPPTHCHNLRFANNGPSTVN